MSKQVLILSSSPRKNGNSETLCDQFQKGAEETGVIYGAGAWQPGDIQGNPAMKEAYQMGRNIC